MQNLSGCRRVVHALQSRRRMQALGCAPSSDSYLSGDNRSPRHRILTFWTDDQSITAADGADDWDNFIMFPGNRLRCADPSRIQFLQVPPQANGIRDPERYSSTEPDSVRQTVQKEMNPHPSVMKAAKLVILRV